jgi:predicted lipid-binding transport protein (Tim44 family)
MSEGIPYADIIILALIAGFILLRLRSVLGQKTGNDDPNFFKRQLPPADLRQEPIVQINEKILKPRPKEEGDPYLATLNDVALVETINAIKAKDAQFSATSFIEGARSAFEMVFDAFAKGDKQTLKMLLADDLYQHFVGEIEAREKEATHPETTLVSVVSKELRQVSLNGNLARLTVKFISEQVTVVRDSSGKIIEGDPSALHHVEDEWVFERDITSKNPNWKIIET